jgi:tetratricopeptide (TPR) repeat protein
MLRNRLLLVGVCALIIFLIFQLPKAVVENENQMSNASAEASGDSVVSHIQTHAQTPEEVQSRIRSFRAQFSSSSEKEKNAIFADSLANLYRLANLFDSAAWFAGESSKFYNTTESLIKAGDYYYQAYTLALDQTKQTLFAGKTQEYYGKALKAEPGNLDVKTKMAMTYLTSSNPMQGITMLREVLAKDPQNELALFNMGMLSIQSGQYDRAINRLEELVKINPAHIQGQLLLGLAWMNSGDKEKARTQFEKVKKMDNDPAVQATVDSYLKDLK